MNLSKTKINALLALALFTFAFLAAEFRFDINIGLLAGAERVVLAQGFILGASVLGFIGYAPLLGLAQRKGHSLAAVNAAAVPIVIPGLAQIQFPTGPLTLEILGRIAFFGLGLLGAATHHAFSLAFQDGPKLATGAGAAYAAGVVFDLAERRYMGLVMLGIAVLSTISIMAVEAGADPNLGLVVFYLSSGFFCHVLYRHVYSAGTAHARTRPLGRHGTRRQQCMRIHHIGHLACSRDLGQCCSHHDRCARAARRRLRGICGGRPIPPAPNRAGARTPATSRESARCAEHRRATPGLHRQPRSHPARSRRARGSNPG